MTEMSIVGVAPSTHLTVTSGIFDLDQKLRQAARESVLQDIAANSLDVTATEIEAMVVVRELQMVNGLDFAAVLLRGERLLRIRRENILSRHPGQYATLDALADDNGLSRTELHFTLDLVDVLFPYLTAHGYNIALLWEEVGSSKFRDLMPILKMLITGEASTRPSVVQAVEALTDEAVTTDRNTHNGEATLTVDEIRDLVVRQLVEDGRSLPVRELRRRINPNPTPTIGASIIRSGAGMAVTMQVDQDQLVMLNRLVGHHVELVSSETTAPAEAALIPVNGHKILAIKGTTEQLGLIKSLLGATVEITELTTVNVQDQLLRSAATRDLAGLLIAG